MKLLQRFSLILLLMSLMTLVACGGGEGDLTGGDVVIEDSRTVTLAISNVNVTEQSPVTIAATVMEGSIPKEGTVVTFSTTLGNFTPEAGTALTNSNGVASLVLNSGVISGAGIVIATLSTGEEGAIGFTTEAVSSSIVLRMGNGTGDDFTESVANLSLDQISAGGTTVVSVSLIDEQGELYSETVEVNFSSRCAEGGTATLSPIVTTSNGLATSTYLAKGCVGNDAIQVNATVASINLSATATINVQQAEIGSIVFESVSIEHIAIRGAGRAVRPESAIVIFKVLDRNSNPVDNIDVTFSLLSDSGEVSLSPLEATTDSEGLVQTVVNSGTVPRVVNVIASIDVGNSVIQTLSNQLKISTGLADQDSMSIATSNLAPQAWNHDGVEVQLTARLGDASNNPPPPTAVYFTTEGGSIENLEASCITGDDGSCTVTWRSQFPRPEGNELGDVNNVTHVPELINTMGQNYGGRVTILATSTGEESFPDLNNNGRFDVCEVSAFLGGVGKPCNADGSFNQDGEDIVYSGNDTSGRPYDQPEAFVDHNEDGYFNPSYEAKLPLVEEYGGEREEPVDFNKNGLYDGRDGKYNGFLCAIPEHDGCSSQKSIDIRSDITIVMSGDTPYICINQAFDSADIPAEGTSTVNDKYFTNLSTAPVRAFCENMPFDHNGDGNVDRQNPDYDDKLILNYKSSTTVAIIMSDLHNQPMPSGSIVSFKSSVGTITSDPTDWGTNHNGGKIFSATIKAGEETDSGTLSVIVELPDGTKESITFMNVFIIP
ncbi:MAG TPA: hypothetical protein DE042_02290 [Colwellia sp.]|nr:hypothetical protein [Colwellia sp.]